MASVLHAAQASALESSTASALKLPSPSLCQRLRDDPVSLVPGTSQLPAFRLIYRLPQLHADNGFPVAARVFGTWIFGDLGTRAHPYALPQKSPAEGFGRHFQYRAYRVPWQLVANSPVLQSTASGLRASLAQLIAAQIERRLLNQHPAGPRPIDSYAARVWGDLRKRFLSAREAAKAAQITTDWLPLPSTGLHFYADVRDSASSAGGELKLTEAAMVFGGASLYPMVQGRIEGTGAKDAWVFKVQRWRQVLVDRFSFEDGHSASTQFVYGLIMGALRGSPGVLEYPTNQISQPLGLWDPQGHLRMRGTPERPVIELLNRSFNDFAQQVAIPLASLRQRLQCTRVAPMQCKPVDLISIGEAQSLSETEFSLVPKPPAKPSE